LTVEVSSLYHRCTLSKAPVSFIDTAKVAAAVLTLALAACAITPPLPSTPLAFSPPAENVPEPPVVAFAFEREADPQFATGGDPNSVTNATLQLRSEYGDLWARIRNGFALPDFDTAHVRQA